MMRYQIMAQLSKFLQQKIPVPYRRNQDTGYVRKPNRFNQFCIISLYRSLKKYMSHILRNFCQNFRFPVIYSLKCLLLSCFSTNSDAFIILFLFSLHFFILILTLFTFLFLFPVLVPVQ